MLPWTRLEGASGKKDNLRCWRMGRSALTMNQIQEIISNILRLCFPFLVRPRSANLIMMYLQRLLLKPDLNQYFKFGFLLEPQGSRNKDKVSRKVIS